MYINRSLEDQIKLFIDREEAIAIVGPRQAGKTTLLKKIEKELADQGKKVKFLNFEKFGDLNLFQDDIENFIELHKNYDVVIIDEFQYAKEGGKKLKLLVDLTPLKCIISGSSSLELSFQTAKHMVGRLISFELHPFSFREYLLSQDEDLYRLLSKKVPDAFSLTVTQPIFGSEINKRLSKYFEDYLVWGGYPAVALAKIFEKEKLLESVASNYLLKDIGSLLKLATEDELMKLARLLAAQISNLINYNELSNASDLKFLQLKKHINILIQTYIIDIIKPFYVNKRTELVKNPKIYFVDSGFRNWILTDFRKISLRSDVGALVENFVFNEIKRKWTKNINYWRTKSGAEVDFIVQFDNKIVPIEVKYTNKPVIGKSLHSFIDKFSPERAVVLTKEYTGSAKTKETVIDFIPVYYL